MIPHHMKVCRRTRAAQRPLPFSPPQAGRLVIIMSEQLQLAPYPRADLSPGQIYPRTATTQPSNTHLIKYHSASVLQKQFYEIQVLSAAAAACLDVSFPIDHFPPDRGGNGFRRTT